MNRIILSRERMWERIHEDSQWDVVIIGGGATGMGVAVESASRGYRTLLVEQFDFGKGTSGKSTKLIHGGVRYLQQGNIALVLEALKERGILHRNAPHLVHDLPFVIPLYDWWEGPFYGIGLRLYDWMAGKEGFGVSRHLSVKETLARIPTIETHGLRGGVIYHDGQFDDARLLINLAATAAEHGATILNYTAAIELIKENNLITGVKLKDKESNIELSVQAKVVINAAGVGVDAVRRLDDPAVSPIISASRGTHIVLDKSFLPGNSAIMVPHTDDGRVLFAIPWHDAVLVGTTDIQEKTVGFEPVPTVEEVDFLLRHAGRYLKKNPKRRDVRSVFTGLRPLVSSANATDTAALSREHEVLIAPSGLVTIAGGKWTTWRKMAEDTINIAADVAALPDRESHTKNLPIHGSAPAETPPPNLAFYGSDSVIIRQIMANNPSWAQPLTENWPLTAAEVIYFVRYEMARTVEDVLSRRHRVLLLNARIAQSLAEPVARLMGAELGKPAPWIRRQLEQFRYVSQHYRVDSMGD